MGQDRKGPLIYVPSHKSHIDYFVLNCILFDHHTHVPRIAAGKNLAFWPMGHIFRKCGAFFIRRSFRQDTLYVEVFNRYIKALLEDAHPIEFYIEGGRSRNGKLVSPKKGFISILLQAHKQGYCKDLIFVPASIAYDRVLEESSYLKEIAGGSKEKENLRQVLKARGFLKRSYGKIYIRFAEPFSLTEFLQERPRSPQEVRQSLALKLVQDINSVTPLTPLSLLATAILSNHRRGFFSSELLDTVKTLMTFLKRLKAPLASSLTETDRAMIETLALLVKWKILDFIQDAEGAEEPFYYVEEEKKVQLEYYKNSIIHYLIGHAFVAVSLLCGREDDRSESAVVADYDFLEDLFRGEFVFDEKKASPQKVAEALEFFLERGFHLRFRTTGRVPDHEARVREAAHLGGPGQDLSGILLDRREGGQFQGDGRGEEGSAAQTHDGAREKALQIRRGGACRRALAPPFSERTGVYLQGASREERSLGERGSRRTGAPAAVGSKTLRNGALQRIVSNPRGDQIRNPKHLPSRIASARQAKPETISNHQNSNNQAGNLPFNCTRFQMRIRI